MEATIDTFRETAKILETNFINFSIWSGGSYSLQDFYEMPGYMTQIVYKTLKEKLKAELSRPRM